MFGWGVLKREVLESVWFCTGRLLMYTFLVPAHPYQTPTFKSPSTQTQGST